MTEFKCYRCGTIFDGKGCSCRDGITLVWGDCREVLPLIAPGSVDLVLTDPPYGIINKFSDQDRGASGRRSLSFAWDSSEAVAQAVAQAVGSRNKPAAAICFVGLDTVAPVQDAMRSAGMTPKPLVWVKKHPTPPMKGNWWPSAFELGIYAYDSGAYFADKRLNRCNVWVADSYRYGVPGKNGHPTQKPLSIIRHMLESTCKPGGLVLDCFAGSGTTLHAAKDLGRKCIGVEICEAYVKIAAERLKQDVLPFGDEAAEENEQPERRPL